MASNPLDLPVILENLSLRRRIRRVILNAGTAHASRPNHEISLYSPYIYRITPEINEFLRKKVPRGGTRNLSPRLYRGLSHYREGRRLCIMQKQIRGSPLNKEKAVPSTDLCALSPAGMHRVGRISASRTSTLRVLARLRTRGPRR